MCGLISFVGSRTYIKSKELLYSRLTQAHEKGKRYEIDLEKFAIYVKDKIEREDVMVGNVHLLRAKQKGYIEAIAGGLDIWNDPHSFRKTQNLNKH